MGLTKEVIDHQGKLVSRTRISCLRPVAIDQCVDARRDRVIREVALVLILEHTVDSKDTTLARASHGTGLLLRGVHLAEQLWRVLPQRHEAGAVHLASDPVGPHRLIPGDFLRRQHLTILILLHATSHHGSLGSRIFNMSRDA